MDTSPAINTFLCKTKHRDSRGRPGRSFRSRVRHREYGDTPHTARIGPLTLASRRVLEDATWSVSSVRSASPVRLIERRNGRACHANYEKHRRRKERTAASKRNRERERERSGDVKVRFALSQMNFSGSGPNTSYLRCATMLRIIASDPFIMHNASQLV